MANHNHQNFNARLNFANTVPKEHFSFEVPKNKKI